MSGLIEPISVARVLAAIEQVVGPGRVPPGSDGELALSNGGLWLGSLELVEIIVACENAFGVALDPEKDLTPETLRTAGNLTASLNAVRARTIEAVK